MDETLKLLIRKIMERKMSAERTHDNPKTKHSVRAELVVRIDTYKDVLQDFEELFASQKDSTTQHQSSVGHNKPQEEILQCAGCGRENMFLYTVEGQEVYCKRCRRID